MPKEKNSQLFKNFKSYKDLCEKLIDHDWVVT